MTKRIWWLLLLIGCSGEKAQQEIVSKLQVVEKPFTLDSDGAGFDRLDKITVFKVEIPLKILSTESYDGLVRLRQKTRIPVLLVFDRGGKKIDSLQLFPNEGGGTIYPPLGDRNNSIWNRHKAEFLNDSIFDLTTEILSHRFDLIEGKPDTTKDLLTGLSSKRYSISNQGKIRVVDSLKVSPY